MAEDPFVTKIITLAGIALLFLITLFVLKSIILSIIVGLLLAYIFHPIFKIINRKIKSKNLATVILLLLILVVIAIPIWFLTPIIVKQTFDTYVYFQEVNIVEPLQKLLPSIFTAEFAKQFSVQFNSITAKIFSTLLNQFTALLVNIPNLLLQFVIILFTFFFAVRDADKLKQYAWKLSPFTSKTEKTFMKEFRNITNAIIYGQVLIGVIQGLALGVGLFILGVPRALILTMVAVIASIIPMLGSWLIWLPVSLFLIFTGNILQGVILLFYGALVVSSIDNIIRPYIISKSSAHLSLPIALIGTIGGLYAFGIIGLVLGPLILAYTIIIMEFYRQGKLNELFKK